MKIETPQIAWNYDVENTTCIAFHPTLPLLAVGGSDSTGHSVYLRIWNLDIKTLEEKTGTPELKKEAVLESIFRIESELQRGHSATVNAVAFSPCGLFLASGGDDNRVVLWTEKFKPKEFGSSEMTKAWADQRELSGHSKEVYDVRWFSDCKHLVSASLDFRAIVWDIETGSIIQTLDGHTNYVKGCAIDPIGLHVLTQSTDRTIKIFKAVKQRKCQFICKASVRRMKLGGTGSSQPQGMIADGNMPEDESKEEDYFKLFLDENLVETFFRRPDWSPDGSCFLVPAAQYQAKASDPPINCVLGFTRGNVAAPSFCLPMKSKPAILCRFSPCLFKREPGDQNLFSLPYHLVWAIGTAEKVLVYSSRSTVPLYVVSNLHYGCLTDLTWYRGHTLAVSAMDGYISFGFFSNADVGPELEEESRQLITQTILSS